MAGKKKKSLANKLAKMSDEERARYLQHRADVEVETKRRKEELIATFMKKKIKKEEAFSRLNLAKINQNWHQILRKAKCQEMRENVDHMKKWIGNVLVYKNKTISKLMEELEEAEEQYSNNFQYHSTHINDTIESQHQYIEKLQTEYENDLQALIESTEKEKETICENAKVEEEYLKTVLYGQETVAKQRLRKEYEDYMQKCYESESSFQSKLNLLRKSRERTISTIWRQIAATVDRYVKQTDVRRSHLAELKRLDAESAREIAENEENISKKQEVISYLKEHYASLLAERESKMESLSIEVEVLNQRYLKIRKLLQSELKMDEIKLKLLTETACKTSQYMEKLLQKEKHLRNLAITCKKFETEREKTAKWFPVVGDFLKTREESLGEAENEESSELKNVDSVTSETPLVLDQSLSVPAARPKTAAPGRLSTQSAIVETPTPESRKITTVNNITLEAKNSEQTSAPSRHSSTVSIDSSPSSATDKPSGILDRCFDTLKDLERFWFTYGKAEVDYMEIKDEKRVLVKENKQLRGMIRAILEAAAMSNSIPNSKVSTRLPSRRRSAYSAPLRRVVFY